MTAYIDGRPQYRRTNRTDPAAGQPERPIQRAFWVSYILLILVAVALYLLWTETPEVPAPLPASSERPPAFTATMTGALAHYRQIDYRPASGTQRPERSVWDPVPAQLPFDRPCELATDSLAMTNPYTAESATLPLRAHAASAGGAASKSRETKVRANPADLQAPGHPRSSTLLTP